MKKENQGATNSQEANSKTRSNNINSLVEIRFEAEKQLLEQETLEQYTKSLAQTYKEHGLTKQNLLHDLLYVFKEKVRSQYVYDAPSYRRELKKLFEDTQPKKGVLKTERKASIQKLLEYKDQDINAVLSLSTNQLGERKKKQRISHILTARFVDQYHPKTLARENDTRMYYYERGVYREGGRKKIKEYIVETVGEEYANVVYKLCTDKIEAYTYLWRDEEQQFFETNTHYLCLENGLLNIQTGKLEPHTPQKVFFEKLPVRYNEESETRTIQRFVEDLVEKDKDVQTIQEIFGYCLLKNYKYKKAFIFLGDKNNGKSTILNILIELLGKRNISNVKLQDLGKRFQKRWIVNKLANIVADIPSSKISETADFKGLTGQDMMMYEVKGGGAYTFRNHAKLIYSANELPAVNNVSDAFYERWVLVDFPYTFISQKKYEKLENKNMNMEMYKIKDPDATENFWKNQSRSGVLKWAIQGLQRLQDQKGFSQTNEVKNKWIAETNSFKSFANRFLQSGSNEYIFQDHLDEVYTDWCNENNHTVVSSRREWRKTLEQMFKVSKKRKRTDNARKWIYKGVKFKPEHQQNFLDGNGSFFKQHREDDSVEENIGFEQNVEGAQNFFKEHGKMVEEQFFVETFSESFLESLLSKALVYRPKKGYVSMY